jgi:CelD/BcsL family acetyltransferase involved in cellulose biosynthesis
MSIDCTVVTHPGELEKMRSAWQAVFSADPAASVYQSWEWQEAWWRHFGARKRLHLLRFVEEGRLVGLAPLYVSRHLCTPFRRLAWCGTGPSDYLGLLAEPGRHAECAVKLFQHLRQWRGYDLADLQQLAPENPVLHEAEHRISQAEPGIATAEMEPCPMLPLAETWEATAAQLGKKTRSNIGYYERLLLRDHPAAETRLTSAEELEEAMDALFELHQARWRGRGLPGVMGGSRIRRFHLETARRFDENGWLRLHRLIIEGRDTASLYCFAHRGRTYYYLGGFDPALGRYSLGTILTAAAVRQAVREGHETFDFLRGAEPYKQKWKPHNPINRRVLIWRPGSAAASALRAVLKLEQAVEMRAKQWSDRRGRSGTK